MKNAKLVAEVLTFYSFRSLFMCRAGGIELLENGILLHMENCTLVLGWSLEETAIWVYKLFGESVKVALSSLISWQISREKIIVCCLTCPPCGLTFTMSQQRQIAFSFFFICILCLWNVLMSRNNNRVYWCEHYQLNLILSFQKRNTVKPLLTHTLRWKRIAMGYKGLWLSW